MTTIDPRSDAREPAEVPLALPTSRRAPQSPRMTAATVFWRCMSCDARGTTTGTESGADVRHVKATTHATTTTLEAIICGARETRTDGNWECVRPPQHEDVAHYWVRLTQRKSA